MDISFDIKTPNSSAELKTIKGTVKIHNKLTIAVKVTDKATSPSANFVNMLDVTPPGAAAITITPKAISTGMIKNLINIKATIGSRITWQMKPIIKSLGFVITLKKSLASKPRPKPNIIIAKAIGAILVAISIDENCYIQKLIIYKYFFQI